MAGVNKIKMKIFSPIFQLTCFFLAGYMVYVQFHAFFSNQDVSNITYKKFVDGTDSMYPTFSVCGHGLIFNKWTFSSGQSYATVLKGVKETNHPLWHDHSQNYTTIQFDDVVINFNELFTRFYTLTNTREKNFNATLDISHFDPLRVCVTKKDFPKTVLVDEDHFEILLFGALAENIRLGMMDIDFYVHQKGQLLKRINYPDFHLDRDHVAAIRERYKRKYKAVTNDMKMTVRSIDVIRKRQDAIAPCDPNLHEEDDKLRQVAINAIGCIPPYMRRFVNESKLLKQAMITPFCNQTQYADAYEMHLNFAKVQTWYIEPCDQMSSIVTTTESLNEKEDRSMSLRGDSKITLRFRLNFLTDSYKETVNTLAFSMATLWSQIGGFVGIFLGYSLLQIPELIEICVVRIKSILHLE